MRRWFWLSLVAAAAFGALAGCDLLGGGDAPEVPVGTFTTMFDSYVITEDTITYTGFTGDVVAGSVVYVARGVNNDRALGDNVSFADTLNAGHAVIQWTEPDSLAGSYNVFRWGDVPGTADQKYMATWFSEPDFNQGAFPSVSAALQGAQNETGSWFMGTYTEQ